MKKRTFFLSPLFDPKCFLSLDR